MAANAVFEVVADAAAEAVRAHRIYLNVFDWADVPHYRAEAEKARARLKGAAEVVAAVNFRRAEEVEEVAYRVAEDYRDGGVAELARELEEVLR